MSKPKKIKIPIKKQVFLWLPCLLYYGLIVVLSDIPGSEFNRYFVSPFVHFDKLVHFVIYAFLGMVLSRALSWEEHYNNISKKWFVYFAIMIPIIALADEIHQSFVPMRQMDGLDIVADIAGAVCGGLFYVFVIRGPIVGKKLKTAADRDARGFGLIVAMTYFLVLLSLNVVDYNQAVIRKFDHLAFGFILIEFGLLGLLSIRFFYLRHHRKYFLSTDWLWLVLMGACFIGTYQFSIYFLKHRLLTWHEILWSLSSFILGASGYYFDKQIEKFRKAIHEDPLYKRKTWQRVYFFLPPFVIFCVINYLSHQQGKELYTLTIPKPQDFLPKEGFISIFRNFFLLHGIQFFFFGVFYFRAITWECWWHRDEVKKWIWTFSYILLLWFAVGDEVHQYFTPTRVGDPYDVATNILGGTLALLIYSFGYRVAKDKFFSDPPSSKQQMCEFDV